MHTPACPCCSNTLLRHIRSQGIYWFCSGCYQEMPTLSTNFSLFRPTDLRVGVGVR